MAMREEIVENIRAAGLSRVQHALEKALRGAIRITSTPAPSVVEVGASRIGGMPDLPADENWPERAGKPLAFLAQFRMPDVAPYDTARLLPHSGMMYFFYDAEEQPWGSSDEGDGWKVIHREGERLEQREPPTNLPEACRFAPRAVRLSTETTLPDNDSQFVQGLDLNEEEAEAYTELLGELGGGESGRHRFLGHPDVIQNPMEDECERESRDPYYSIFPEGQREARMAELAERAREWRLLFQLDTDDDAGMMWGDVGRLYFWIREDSLRAQRWDDVWLILQCS